jgi:hypothetical protein
MAFPIAAVLAGLKVLADLAGLVSSLKNIFVDDGLDEQLDQVLRSVQDLKQTIVRGIADILEAIDGIRRQIDEDVGFDNMSLADRALFSDLAVFGNQQEAMGNSFQAADRLLRETDVVFAGPFMYVVSIRLAVLKDFDPNFFCQAQFQNEFRRYIDRLNGWIAQLNEMIRGLHTVSIRQGRETVDTVPPTVFRWWIATHLRAGVVVRTFEGPFGNTSQAARDSVERQAQADRDRGIEEDRVGFGVVEMERTVAAWTQAFTASLRIALVTQVLGRRPMAVDFDPAGLLVDGRVVRTDLDPRATLTELLVSREFHSRIEKSWTAFLRQKDDRLAQFVHRRLFDREATEEDVNLLRGVASSYGFPAFIATLLYSNQYEERFGRGLPNGGAPVVEALAQRPDRTQGATGPRRAGIAGRAGGA